MLPNTVNLEVSDSAGDTHTLSRKSDTAKLHWKPGKEVAKPGAVCAQILIDWQTLWGLGNKGKVEKLLVVAEEALKLFRAPSTV